MSLPLRSLRPTRPCVGAPCVGKSQPRRRFRLADVLRSLAGVLPVRQAGAIMRHDPIAERSAPSPWRIGDLGRSIGCVAQCAGPRLVSL